MALDNLDNAFAALDPVRLLAALDPPSIEQILFDLRRLDRQRRTGPTRQSKRWLAAVMCAYDLRLCLACRYFGLAEHLQQLQGMDRDIERVRIEGRLQAAGLALRS